MSTQVPRRTATKGDILRILLAILLPPVGVFLQVGFGIHLWINIPLTLLGYIPGIVHAVWIIATRSWIIQAELTGVNLVVIVCFPCLEQGEQRCPRMRSVSCG